MFHLKIDRVRKHFYRSRAPNFAIKIYNLKHTNWSFPKDCTGNRFQGTLL